MLGQGPETLFERVRLVADGNKYIVLVVDDSYSIRKEVSLMLEKGGYDVRTAGSEIGLMEQIDAYGKVVDLILMDITLKRENGFDLIKKLKTIEVFRGIPVLMLSQHRDVQHVMLAKKAEVQGYLVKPVQREVLVERVRKLLPDKVEPDDQPEEPEHQPEEAENQTDEQGSKKAVASVK